MTSEMEELLRAVQYTSAGALPVQIVIEGPSSDNGQAAGANDVSQLAVEVNRLNELTQSNAALNVAPPKESKTQSKSSSDNSSTAETVLRTVGTLTGVGPVVTGLMRLFGGGSDPEPLAPLEKFQLPQSVSVEAGLSGNRDYGSIRYQQGGVAQLNTTAPADSRPAIQVNIQAFDSQSFLDRRDDIAKAVREAMLHSNSLNDVVQEL